MTPPHGPHRPPRPPWWYAVIAALATFIWVVWAFVWSNPLPSGDGRPEPGAILMDPSLVVTEPDLLATAVEARVNDVVEACLAEQGLEHTGLALPSPQSLGKDGYGVSAAPSPEVYVSGNHTSQFHALRERYEAAMYGGLDDEAPGGCGQRALFTLESAVEAIRNLDYGIDELEADLLSDPTYRTAERAWAECMADRGHDFGSPEAAISSLQQRYARLRGADAAAFADEERRIAAADAACRASTLEVALQQIATEHGERFVDANRETLEELIRASDGPPDVPGDLGGGDVQVTLLWHDEVDLDLSVRDPSGDVVDFDTRQVPSGGELDRDANFPCSSVSPEPIENVFWPADGAPVGDYVATVRYRTGCGAPGPVPYRVVIRVEGRIVQDTSGAIDPADAIEFPFGFGSNGG